MLLYKELCRPKYNRKRPAQHRCCYKPRHHELGGLPATPAYISH